MKKKSKKKMWLYRNKKRWLFHGSISTGRCADCNEQLFYFYKYDALCCPRCNIWHDSKCGDINCVFCANRPEMPSMGIYEPENCYFDKKSLFVRKYSHRLKRQNHRNLRHELQYNGEEKR